MPIAGILKNCFGHDEIPPSLVDMWHIENPVPTTTSDLQLTDNIEPSQNSCKDHGENLLTP